MALALKKDREYNGYEIIIERPDGTRIAVLAHANPIRDETGNLLGAVNVLVDITDRKRTEDALKAEDRAKNEFLATLAHELRNPLAPVRNAVEILRLKVPASRESKWALEVIDRQIRQMTRLVDDLLDLARITSDKLTLQKERIELAEVVNAAIETSRPVIDASGQELTVNVPEQPIPIDGDLTRLAQVISNLLNNAAKYTAPDGRITLTAERQGSDVVISVRDTGIGVPVEMLPRIFDMFAQVDRSLERSQGGLGVGLTLAKRLVDMHGGTITAWSDGPWMGSEFVVRLPIPPSRNKLSGPRAAGSSRRIPAPRSGFSSSTTTAMLQRASAFSSL